MDNNMLLNVMETTDGAPVEFDLKAQGNLLLCGGSMYGRTILLNALIYQLASRMRRSDIRFLMMGIEDNSLSCYEELPQLEMPIITHPMECARMLMWVVREMEERYRVFKRFGVPDIDEFNALSFDEKITECDSSEDMPVAKTMPRLIVVAADLYIFLEGYQEWVMRALALLNKRSLATGIHLVFSQPMDEDTTMERLAAYGFHSCVKGDFPNFEHGNAENLLQGQKVRIDATLENDGGNISGIFSYERADIMQWVDVAGMSRVREAFVNESGIISLAVVDDYLQGNEKLDLLRGLTETEVDVSDRLVCAAARLIRRTKLASTHNFSLNLGISDSKAMVLMDRLLELELISGEPGEPKALNQDLILEYIRNAKRL